MPYQLPSEEAFLHFRVRQRTPLGIPFRYLDKYRLKQFDSFAFSQNGVGWGKSKMSKCKVKIGVASCQNVSGRLKSGGVFRRPDGTWEIELSDDLIPADRLQIKLHHDFGTFEAPVGAVLSSKGVEARLEIGLVSLDGLQGELRAFGRQDISRTLVFDGPDETDMSEDSMDEVEAVENQTGVAIGRLSGLRGPLGLVYQFSNGDLDVLMAGGSRDKLTADLFVGIKCELIGGGDVSAVPGLTKLMRRLSTQFGHPSFIS